MRIPVEEFVGLRKRYTILGLEWQVGRLEYWEGRCYAGGALFHSVGTALRGH